MKKVSFLLILLLLTAPRALADVFDIGPTAGINITKVDGSGWQAAAGEGWFAGLKCRTVAPVVGLGLDGAVILLQERITLGGFDDNVGYIAFPLHLRYEVTLPLLSRIIAPYGMAGAQLNYCIDDLDLTMGDVLTLSDRTDRAFQTRNATWRFNAGAGVLLFRHLEVGYTYSLPLGHTFSETYDNYSGRSHTLRDATHRVGLTWYF